MKDAATKIQGVLDQKSFAEFVALMAQEFSESGDQWENKDLQSFLDAMSGWIESMDGYYLNTGQAYDEKNVTWKTFADIMWAATMYS